MNKKVLWKIEELWNRYSLTNINNTIDILGFYRDSVSIYNSDFHLVDDFDFTPSQHIVHTDDYGDYYGLSKSQVSHVDGKLIYLFDNHNKILQAFLECFELKKQSFDVVHIDAHPDDAVFPAEKPQALDIKKVPEYINKTRISDFFDFVSETNMIDTIHRYTKSSDFKQFKKPKNPYILSLDIDIFGREGGFVDLDSKIKIIAEAWSEAEIVCIATSPGFIDQDFTHKIIDIFTNEKA